MIAQRQLNDPPIQEALIDFHVTLPNEAKIEALSKIYEDIKEEYPIQKPIQHGTVGLNLQEGKEPSTSIEHEIVGYRYETEDGTSIVQFRMNGFTFSKLRPYKDWDDMEAKAKKLWNLYCRAMAPILVTRVATRFINVIRIPLPISDFADYFTAPPKIPEALPQSLSSFISRIVVPEPNFGGAAIITQALEKVEDGTAPVVLDIDVFINRQFDPNSDDFLGNLKFLHDFKNKIFFESITERTVELF